MGAVMRLSPFVGRDTEMNQLMALWGKALQGERSVVFIQGAVSEGKSRLVMH